jgi:hypothetical protein
MLFVSNKVGSDQRAARHFGRKMCEERTDDASRNLADTKATANHVEACAKKIGRASPFLVF